MKVASYFVLGDSYYTTAEYLLSTIRKYGNKTYGVADTAEEVDKQSTENYKKSDVILLRPALFSCLQAMELFIKGTILAKGKKPLKTHDISKLINQLETVYNDEPIVYETFKRFYDEQMDIVKKFKQNNGINTTEELYESLRYPENKPGKFFDYIDLTYKGKTVLYQYEEFEIKMQEVKDIVVKVYRKYKENTYNK